MSKLSLSLALVAVHALSLVIALPAPTDFPILKPAAPKNTDEATTEDLEAIVVDAAASATTTIDGILENDGGSGSSGSSVVKEFDPNDCFLMKERGPCRAAIDSWFFNVGTKSCENFLWSGCGGNKNRFRDQSTCETHCSQPFASSTTEAEAASSSEPSSSTSDASSSSSTTPSAAAVTEVMPKELGASSSTAAAPGASNATTTPAPSTTTTSSKPKLPVCPKFDGCPSKCVIIQDRSDRGCKKCLCGAPTATNDDESKKQLPPNIQITAGNITVDSSSASPVVEPVGSVSGSPSSKEEEEVDAPIVGSPKEVCQLPAKRGHCRAMQTRYRYDSKIKDCVQFHYGGCDANPNNFVSKDKCAEYCKGQ